MDELLRRSININDRDIMLTTDEIAYKNREIYIVGEINAEKAKYVNSVLRDLARMSKDPITLYIESPGGSTSAALSIYDTAKSLDIIIKTVASGTVASAASFLLACAGTRDYRCSFENTEILIHQPWCSGVQGQVSDLRIVADHGIKLRSKMNKILANSTGKSIEQIETDTDRDLWLTAEEALGYGLIDKIIDRFPF